MNWSKDWPTTPGFYWFFGSRFGNMDKEPKLHVASVKSQGSVVCDGAFIYKSEAKGYFLPLNTPELPNGPIN